MLARFLHAVFRTAGLAGPQASSRSRLAAVVVATVALVGCDTEPPAVDAPVPPVRTRLITEIPSEKLDSARWTRTEPVFRWSFRSDADLAPWSAQDVDGRFAIDGDGVVVETSRNDPRLLRPVEIDASQVHAIEVRMGAAGKDAGRNLAELFWAGPGEPFAVERGMTAEGEGRDATYVFLVGQNPGWSGAIRRLRFDPTRTAGRAMRVREIVGLRRRVDRDAFEALTGKPWRVDVGNEVRSAFLVAPDDALEWKVRVPDGGRLRFEHTVWRELAAPAPGTRRPRLRVTLTPEGGEPVRLLGQRLAPDDPRPRWQQHELDLSEWAGTTVTLTIAAHARPPAEPLRGLLVVANPEIVGAAPADAPPNVLLVSIDTLRADHLSLHGYARPTSPHIDAWAARSGVVFENAFAQAPWTLPSHVSMLTGLDPLRHGANYDRPIPADLSMLAERLRDAGWATAAVTGGVYLHPRYGFDQGFDRYHYWYGAPLIQELDDAAERTRAYLREHAGEPFFLFLHTYAVHSPYWYRAEYLEQIDGPPIPEPPRNVNVHPLGNDSTRAFVHRHEPRWHGQNAPGEPRLLESELPAMIRLYDAGIRYADERVGAVLAELDALGLAENTLVIVTSDHGEMMGEHGEFSHASLRDPVLRVPLVMALPSRFPGGRRVGAQVRSIDIPPTVVDLLGLPALPDVDGVSLRPWLVGSGDGPALDAWAYAPHPNLGVALRVGNALKYTFNDAALEPIAGAETLYRLPDDVDETRNVAASAGETTALRGRVQRHLDERAGLRATITNASREPLRLALGGTAAYPTRLKVLKAGCRCVDWKGSSGIVALPPGRDVTLLFEDVAPGRELIVRRLPEGRGVPAEVVLAIEPSDGPGPWGAELTDAGWRQLEAPERAPATGIRLWWHGATLELPAAAPADPALSEQLRALGYVE